MHNKPFVCYRRRIVKNKFLKLANASTNGSKKLLALHAILVLNSSHANDVVSACNMANVLRRFLQKQIQKWYQMKLSKQIISFRLDISLHLF